MIHARSYAPLGLTALAGLAVVIVSRGGLDLGLDTGGLRHGISFTTASALALVTLAGVSIVGRGAPVSASSGALALGALAALASSPTLLVLAGSLAAGAHPAVIAALSAATAVGGVPDRLDGLNADHALGIVLGLFGLLSARGPLAPLSLLITTSLVAPALWASGWGRVALISGGVGLATLTAIGAALDKSRSASCLGWAWVGLGLAAMGAAAAPLGLALGLSGLGLAAMCEQTAADDPARPSPWAIGLGALAAGGVPSLGVGGGRDALLGLIVSGDPIAAAGVLLVSAATGYCLGRAPPARRSPAVLSLIAAPLVWGLSRWLSPTVAVPRVELHLVGALASAVTLGAGIWAFRGGRLPERALPADLPQRWPRPRAMATPTLSSARITKALILIGLVLWAGWTVANTIVLRDTLLGPNWDR